jgi:hypothetical protein
MKKVTVGKSNCRPHFGQASFCSFEARISITGYMATAHHDSIKRRGVTGFLLMIFFYFFVFTYMTHLKNQISLHKSKCCHQIDSKKNQFVGKIQYTIYKIVSPLKSGTEWKCMPQQLV